MDSTTESTTPSSIAETQNSGFNFNKEECFTIRYDEKCKYLAAGYSTGFIGIYDFDKPKSASEYLKKYSISTFPITCLRWKPSNRTTLMTVDAE